MKVLKQWPSEKIRLIAGTTIPYENWIQAWIVTNITKRKEIQNQQKKIAVAKRGAINSYLTADVPDERDLEEWKGLGYDSFEDVQDKKDFNNKQTKDNDHD